MPGVGGLRMTIQGRLHSSGVQGSCGPSVRTCPSPHRVDPYPLDTPAHPAGERCCDPYPANPDRHCSLGWYWIQTTWKETCAFIIYFYGVRFSVQILYVDQ